MYAGIIHEAPIPSVLPGDEPKKWSEFFQSCYSHAERKGASAGAMKFYFGVELPAIRLYDTQAYTSDTLLQTVSKCFEVDDISIEEPGIDYVVSEIFKRGAQT